MPVERLASKEPICSAVGGVQEANEGIPSKQEPLLRRSRSSWVERMESHVVEQESLKRKSIEVIEI